MLLILEFIVITDNTFFTPDIIWLVIVQAIIGKEYFLTKVTLLFKFLVSIIIIFFFIETIVTDISVVLNSFEMFFKASFRFKGKITFFTRKCFSLNFSRSSCWNLPINSTLTFIDCSRSSISDFNLSVFDNSSEYKISIFLILSFRAMFSLFKISISLLRPFNCSSCFARVTCF